MAEGIKNINRKIALFKRKYFFNLFLRGAILLPTFGLFYFLAATLLEYNLWLSRSLRFFILILFVALFGYLVYRFFWKPLRWILYKKGLTEEESAKLIGNHFPFVADRLLNIIQLAASSNRNKLLQASIEQKSDQLQPVQFDKAIDLKVNRKYVRYLVPPILAVIVLAFVDSSIFTKSTTRIIRFNQEFSPEAPFQFSLLNKNLHAFFNEDFTVNFSFEGKSIPISAYLLVGSQRWKMEDAGAGKFQYTFERLQNPLTFQVEGSGFLSPVYKINLVNRPEITEVKFLFSYPSYTGKQRQEVTNAGNIEIPEGTSVLWKVKTSFATEAKILLTSESKAQDMQVIDNQIFTFKHTFRSPDHYSLLLENESSKNKDKISYDIKVIKDQFPEIKVENLKDSVLFKSILLGGQIKDDYGISKLLLHFQIENNSTPIKKESVKIPIDKGSSQESFFYAWTIDSLRLKPGDKLSYYFEVWDNDGVNGSKATRSANYELAIPTESELKSDISNQQESAEKMIDRSLQKAKDLKQAISDVQEKLKGKQSLDWQDKKMLEDLVSQKQKLDQHIEELKKENQLLEQKKESFTNEDERIKEKAEQIQKLMNELLDEETKKLFNELEKLLKENGDLHQIQKMLDKMDRKEINLEKELERTLSLFKQLQYDYKLDQAVNEIKAQLEKQEKLLDRTEESSKAKPEDEIKTKNDSTSKNSAEQLAKDQESLKEETQKFEKTIEDLKKVGEEAEQKEDNLPSEEDIQQLENSEEESQKSLQQGNPKKSTDHQKKSIDKMKKIEKQLEGMQNSMEMEIDMQNLESLRQIVHGLIKLSFDQESLMKEFAVVQQSDPKNIQLSQGQLKLQDDVKVLEDSLLVLSKKDMFMGSIVTKEVGELNDHIEKAVNNMKERHKGNASAEMQFSMTNINNLALMLNDHFEMMMKMMANATPSKGKGKKGKDTQSLGKLQQQINDKIEQLKNGQKSGRQYSEELAKMAAEQARIRKALQEMQDKLKKEGGQIPGNDLPGKMEQTEFDLVNKKITEETIKRQREILTRLLEAEKSMREQNQDEERKGETAKDYNSKIPRAFEEYLRLKEKEVELLKTMPPKLLPYYRKEVIEYYKRIN